MAETAPKKSSKPLDPKSARPTPKASSPAKQGSSAKSSAKPGPAAAGSRPKKRPKKRKSVMQLLMSPFRMISRLFFSDVKLKRDGKNLNVKLVQREAAPKSRPPMTEEQQELDAMCLALKALLDSHPATRRVMRHLVFFESALAQSGLQAIDEIPIEVLTEALKQFESLVTNWSSHSLSDLRSKMSVGIVDRAKDPFYGKSEKVSNFNTDSRLQVEEDDVSHSRFMEIADAFHGRESNKAEPIAKRDAIDFAPTETFEHDALQLLSKDFTAKVVPLEKIERAAPAKAVAANTPDFEPTDFLPTRPFERDQDEPLIKLMPISI